MARFGVALVSGIALVFLTLAGFSSGAVLAGKGKRVLPGLLDLFGVVVLWVAALMTRAALGRGLAILVWLVLALATGLGLTVLRRGRYPDRKQRSPAARRTGRGLRRWWEGWKAFAAEMGNYQGRMLLGLFYFVVVAPFGIALRLFGDPLGLR